MLSDTSALDLDLHLDEARRTFDAGERVVGEYHCSGCGYGVAVRRELPACPMCGGGTWEATTWSPFSRTSS